MKRKRVYSNSRQVERLCAKLIILDHGCWEFDTPNRFRAQIAFRGKIHQPKRVMAYLTWQLTPEQFNDGELCVVHTCHNRLCCNPAHLKVTSREFAYTLRAGWYEEKPPRHEKEKPLGKEGVKEMYKDFTHPMYHVLTGQRATEE